MAETRSTWRVYAKQWVFDSRHDSEEAATQHGASEYADRLDADELQVVVDDLDGETYVLLTNRWGVVAEWKYEDRARAWAQAWAEDFKGTVAAVEVVERNSREEHALLQHGVLKKAPSN